MSDPNPGPHEIESFGDLPIQPTGSGPADLEMAYEQMRLSESADPEVGPGDQRLVTDTPVPTDDSPEAAESGAHPS
ncbi:hypothetical protein ACU5AX_07205 [Sphingomonas sp. XXL09]|uniref:hypothetical protein n=1 Tax=unclassified Sphingomonas TaxID=196159 RepID=UPI0018DF5686|nr:hypothetical protein [Sphingomonas sp. MA1305]